MRKLLFIKNLKKFKQVVMLKFQLQQAFCLIQLHL
ncbi:unnamed protein product, partial [Prunus brigantina]